MSETAPRLEIGPVLQNFSACSDRGIRPDNSENFTGTPAPSSISTSSILIELKDDTSQVDINPPGTVIFDNSEVTSNTALSPTISPTSGATSGGTFVSLTGNGLPAGPTVTTGGTAATSVTVGSVTVVSPMKRRVRIFSYDRLRTAWTSGGETRASTGGPFRLK